MDDLQSYLAREAEKDKGQTLEGAVKLGVQENPDAYAKALQLAAKTGMAPEAVKEALPEVEMADRVKSMDLAGLLKEAPRTAEWMANPDHAAIAHDDLDTLREFERAMPSLSAAPDPTWKDTLNNFWRRAMEGTLLSSPEEAQDIRQAESARQRAARTMGQDPRTFHTGNAATLPASRIAVGTVRGALRPLSGLIRYGERKTGIDTGVGDLTKRWVETLTPPNPTTADTSVENFASTAGLLIPGMVTGKAVGLISKIPSLARVPGVVKAVGPWAQAVGMAVPEAASEAEDAYDNNIARGMKKSEANRIADRVFWGNVALLTVTDRIGWFSKGGLGRAAASEAFQEGGQQIMGNTATGRPTFEGVPEAAAMGAGVATAIPVVGGLAAGLFKTRGLRVPVSTDYTQDFFNALSDGATNSKLLARMPEKFQEAVAAITKDGPVENLRIPAEAFRTFYQAKGLDPAEVAASLGVTNYMEATLSGNDMLIPTAAYATQIAGTEDHAELSKDMRLFEGQLTAREAEAAQAGGEQVAALAREVDAETQAKPEFQTLKEDLKARYIAAGESPAVAETYAMDGAKVFATMATQAGMTPGELYAQYAPKIVRGEAPQIQDVMGEAFTPETFPAEGVAWEDGDGLFFQAEYGAEPYRFEKPIDQKGMAPNLEGGDGNGNQAAGLREVPQSLGRADGGGIRPPGLEAEGTGRGRDFMGAERLRDLAPSPKLQSYQLRNAQVLAVNGVEIAAGPRPPYFSFHGNKAQDGQINLSTSPTNVAGDAVYIAQRHGVAAARAHTGDSGQTLSVYVDTRRYAPLDGRKERAYSPEEAKAFGISVDAPISGRELLVRLNKREGPGKGFSDYLKGLGFNGVAYDYSPEDHAAWSVFDPSVFKRVVDTKAWGPDEIKRREEFDPRPIDQVGPLFQPSTFKPVDTNSTEFKAWFGDSKVVDSNGAPLKMFHGGASEFQAFDMGKVGHNFGDAAGIFFTNNTVHSVVNYGTHEQIVEDMISAGAYANNAKEKGGNAEPNLIPAYLSIKNPLVIEDHFENDILSAIETRSSAAGDFIRDEVIGAGHDGLILRDLDTILPNGQPETIAVATAPTQIKSAISNVGKFDPNNPSLLFQSQNLRDDFSFGSKKWQEYYRNSLRGGAKGDQARRVSEGLKAALTPEGQASFDWEQNAAAKAEEEAFLRFDKAVSRLQRARGWFSRSADGTFTIGKTPDGDFSTFIHEPAHAYLEMFADLAAKETASPRLKEDWAKVLEFLGVESWEQVGTPEHELWARANEVYMREGKAPSQDLRGVFQRFKVWLQAVYRYVSELDAPLSDDIRGVFDRMRATDEEIEIAHAEVAGPQLFRTPEEAGMTEKDFKAYAIEKDLELEQAKAEILAKLNEAALREKSQDWKREEAEVRAAVTDLVDARPEYRAIRALRKGALEDGTPFTLNRGELVREFGEDRVKELQRLHRNLYRVDGIMDAGAAAELLGFDSGETLLQEIESAPKRSAAIADETRRVMTDRHGDIRFDGTLEDQARQAVANEARSRALHRELSALRNKVTQAGEAKAEAKAQAREALVIPPVQTFREAATAMVEAKPILSLDANGYLNGQRRYSREAYKMATQGKYQEAADAKQKELLNHFLYLETVKAKAEAEKIAAYGKRLGAAPAQQRIGKAQGSYLEQINGLLERFDFSRVTNKALREGQAQTLAQFVVGLPEGADAIFEPYLLDERYRKNYREMNLQELRAVKDALKNIEALARQEREFIVEGKAVAFETAITEMVEVARKNNKTVPLSVDPETEGPFKQARKRMQSLDAGLKKVEWLIDHLDGGDINGPWRRYIFNPIAQAQYKERELQEKIGAKLIAAMEDMPAEVRKSLGRDQFNIPGVGLVGKKFILTAALNMGNESNAEKLITGMGWAGDVLQGSPQVEALLSKMTAADWAFVQKTWDGINELWPEIVDLEKRTTGVAPPKVEPRSMTVTTADGQTLRIAGGYYPIAYDPKKSTQGKKQESGGPLDQLFETGYTKASTSRGHTKERVAFSAPLLMDFERVTTRHLSGVIKDISHREAAMAINRMLMNQDLRATVQETMGEAYESMLLPWLRGVVNDSNMGVDGMGEWDGLASKLRSNVVIAGLGFRVSSVVVQATDWVRAMDRVKPRHLGGAILKFSANPAEMIRQVRGLSSEMAGRAENLDRDLRHQWKRLTGKEGIRPSVQRFAMTGLAMADAVTSTTTWWGAYQQALESGSPQAQAIAEADRSVRLALMTGAPKDQVAIQRRKDFGSRFVTMFMGDSTSVYGILGDVQHKLGKGQDIPRQAARLVFSVMLPAILAEMLKGRAPDDDDEKAWWAIKKGLMAFPSSIPVLRDVVQAIDTGRDASFSPVVQGLNKASKAVAADWDLITGDEDQTVEDAFLKSVDAAAILFGLPTSQITSSAKYLNKVATGEENPETTGELIKNTLLGPKPKGGKR